MFLLIELVLFDVVVRNEVVCSMLLLVVFLLIRNERLLSEMLFLGMKLGR